MELGAQMLIAAGAADNTLKAKQMLDTALVSGKGIEKLRELISAQGGNPEVCSNTSLLPQAKIVRDVHLQDSGTIPPHGYSASRIPGAAHGRGTDEKNRRD